MEERMAPAHPYERALGTGIEWTPNSVRLWEQGRVTETAFHSTTSAWEFWYDLHYAAAFPTITHWWFRSIWTGRIAVSLPEPTLTQETELWGTITFDVLDTPRLPWSMSSDTGIVTITPPYPPNEEHPANLPLRLSLARAILLVLDDDMAPDSWTAVTSLVHRDDLATYFPTTHEAAAQNFGGAWRLGQSGKPLSEPPRTELCRLLLGVS